MIFDFTDILSLIEVPVGDNVVGRIQASCDGVAWGTALVVGVEGRTGPDTEWVEWDPGLRLVADGVSVLFSVRGWYAVRVRVLTAHATAATMGRLGIQLAKENPASALLTCLMGRISGKYYSAGPGTAAGTSGTTALNTLHAVPFYVGEPCSFDRISINALNTAGSFMRLGIYADDNGRPGALIVDAGQVNTAVNGMVDATINVTLSGLVWVATVPQTIAGSVSRYGAASYGHPIGTADHYSTFFNSVAYSQGSVTGALPNPWGTTYTDAGTANTVPAVWLRAK